MLKATSLACTTCHTKNHCEECRAYLHSPVAFKLSEKSMLKKTSPTYKRIANFSHTSGVQTHSICSQCDSKFCFACSMYNTNFIKEAE